MSKISKKQINQRVSSSYLVSLLLFVSDLTVFFGSFFLATKIRQALIPYLGGIFYWPMYKPMVFLGMGYVAVIFAFNSLYPGYGKTAVKEVENTSKLLTMVFLFLSSTTYLLNVYELFPRSIFLLSWVMCIVLIPGLRFIIRNRIIRYPWYGIPVLFATDGTGFESTLTALQNCRRMGWNPKAVFSLEKKLQQLENITIPIVYSWEEFLEIKSKEQVHIALFSAEDNQNSMYWLRKISGKFKVVTLMIPYYNLGSLWVEPRDLEGHLGLEVTYHLLDNRSKYVKRLVDIVGSISLLILFSPLFLFLSLLITLESSAPVFFRQDRFGINNKRYPAYKFRSMVKNAEKKLKVYLENNPEAYAEYKEFHKLNNDPRITRIGKFLRKFSLDELPQLWNVLRGDMSLIGPRAYMPSELDEIGDYADIIFRVRPGMTGWWQVMGRQKTAFQARLRMDEYYISNWSLWMDLYIFYKTFWVVVRGTGT